jgi:hypothetical protein
MYRMNKGLPTDKILERKEDNEQNSKENWYNQSKPII